MPMPSARTILIASAAILAAGLPAVTSRAAQAPAPATAAAPGSVSLEAGEGQGLEPGTEAQESIAIDAAPDVLEGESIELPNVHADNSEYEEAADTGQALEAAEIAGVENAPPADVAEVHVHGEEPAPEAEEVVGAEEPQSEEASKPEQME